MKELTYLFGAYSLVWLGIFVYLGILHARIRELEQRLQEDE